MNEDTEAKYKAWGWNVINCNGNDVDEIRKALDSARDEKHRPTLIIGKTIMGKGALQEDGSSYEHSIKTHGAPLGGNAYINTIKNLGGDPENPFVIFPKLKNYMPTAKRSWRKLLQTGKPKKRNGQKPIPKRLSN